MTYMMRFGFLSPAEGGVELVILLTFEILSVLTQIFIFTAGRGMRCYPLAVVFFFFVVIGGIEVLALIVAGFAFIAVFLILKNFCECLPGCCETIMPHSAGEVYTDCFGQMWEVVEKKQNDLLVNINNNKSASELA